MTGTWLSGPLLLIAACGSAAAMAMQDEAASSSPGSVAAAGRYRGNAGPDVAAQLELRPDGRFRFFLAAGSLDSRAEGRWTSDGRAVILNTEPRPTPPAFAAGPVARTAEHPLSILVNGPDGRGIASIDVRVGMADERAIEGYTQDYGWQPGVDDEVGTPRWVELSALIHGVPLRRFELDMAAGNAFTFILIPNDLGVADFNETAAEITAEGLNLPFLGAPLPFVRER